MKYREITKALEKALQREVSFDMDGDVVRARYVDLMAERMVAMAASGNVDAFRAVVDRVEGKAVQRLDVGVGAIEYYDQLSEDEIRRELENEMRIVGGTVGESSGFEDKPGEEAVLGILQVESP